MRRLLLVFVWCCGLPVVSAQQAIVPPASDTSSSATRSASTGLADVLWGIAVSSKVPIGFESVDDPMRLPYSVNASQVFDRGTLTEALNAAVSVDERYEWRFVDDMVVVRPKTAWTDAADPLNRQVRDLQISSLSVVGVLTGLQGLIYDSRFEPRGSRTAGNVSLRVDSATVLHVLNKLTKTAEQVMWVADYRPSRQPALTLTMRGPRLVTAWAETPIRRESGR